MCKAAPGGAAYIEDFIRTNHSGVLLGVVSFIVVGQSHAVALLFRPSDVSVTGQSSNDGLGVHIAQRFNRRVPTFSSGF